MTRVVHFEFSTDKPDESIAFFENVFGWRIEKWDSKEIDYWLIMTGDPDKPGIDGGFGLTEKGFPGIVNTIDVDDVDAAMEKVLAHGGEMVMPKMAIPGVGYMAYFKDINGNVWSVMKEDRSAGMA